MESPSQDDIHMSLVGLSPSQSSPPSSEPANGLHSPGRPVNAANYGAVVNSSNRRFQLVRMIMIRRDVNRYFLAL